MQTTENLANEIHGRSTGHWHHMESSKKGANACDWIKKPAAQCHTRDSNIN